MKNPDEVREQLLSMPEVTKEEAFAAATRLCFQAEGGDDKAVACLCALSGFVAVNGDPEMARRFIVYLNDNGPLI